MKSVDADMSHLDIRTEAAQTLGACAKPLGQALQLIAGFMDNVANVSPSFACDASQSTDVPVPCTFFSHTPYSACLGLFCLPYTRYVVDHGISIESAAH